jgi:hypothetical protein
LLQSAKTVDSRLNSKNHEHENAAVKINAGG